VLTIPLENGALVNLHMSKVWWGFLLGIFFYLYVHLLGLIEGLCACICRKQKESFW
jgi:hypothetical protein